VGIEAESRARRALRIRVRQFDPSLLPQRGGKAKTNFTLMVAPHPSDMKSSGQIRVVASLDPPPPKESEEEKSKKRLKAVTESLQHLDFIQRGTRNQLHPAFKPLLTTKR
jgi:hypothetical protein